MNTPSMLVNGKISKKKLIVILDEGDNVLESIHKAMRDNFISKAGILAISGVIKNGEVNYFLGNSYRNKKIENVKIERATGHFILSKKTGIFGNLKALLVIDGERDSFTIAKALAKNEMQIEMEFFELV